mmetsp:Transcript_22219/g.21446  ORF Transcript_22219/g.21446 Transcript_22219/m.21446 type:complete len:223 (+) Transcript_22219:385-1053(+)
MNNWLYSSFVPTDPWRGQMSFPIDFFLMQYNEKYYLGSKPNSLALESAFSGLTFDYQKSERELSQEDLNHSMQDFVEETNGLLYIKAIVEMKEPVDFGFLVKSDYQGEFTDIGVNADNCIWVDRSESGRIITDIFSELNSLPTDYIVGSEEETILELLIDKSSVEVFFFDGMYSMTNIIFPEEESLGLTLWSNDFSKLSVKQLQIFELKKTMGSDSLKEVTH